jgi:hypothetical protein
MGAAFFASLRLDSGFPACDPRLLRVYTQPPSIVFDVHDGGFHALTGPGPNMVKEAPSAAATVCDTGRSTKAYPFPDSFSSAILLEQRS